MGEVLAKARRLNGASPTRDRMIDITTIGARSGQPRRIEIWLWSVEGTLYLASDETPRAWFANVKAHPHLTLHFKNDGDVDVPVKAAIITDPTTRRRVLAEILEESHRDPNLIDLWVARSPLVELVPEGI
jgi:deazaflavin-dependent oxidoreductase (nitroreductase family)